MWEKMSLSPKSKNEKKKGENTSEIPTKKRRKDETPLTRNKNQKQEEGEVMSEEEDE